MRHLQKSGQFAALAAVFMAAAPLSAAAQHLTLTLESNIDRTGGDYREFYARSLDACRTACLIDTRCRAHTFMRRGRGGYCWLKDKVPPGQPSTCCTSGVKMRLVSKATATQEPDIDRPGGDYRHFDLPQPRVADCYNACLLESRCKAYTYVKPGVQGPSARCWLKGSVPASLPSGCCTSGVKQQEVREY